MPSRDPSTSSAPLARSKRPSRPASSISRLAAPCVALVLGLSPHLSARAQDTSSGPPAPPTSSSPASTDAPPSDAPRAAPSTGAPSTAAGPSDPAEGKPARPPPLPPADDRPLPWDRLLDLGGDFALAARPASADIHGRATSVRYEAATGFGLRLRIPIFQHLAFEAYYVDVHMPLRVPYGALGLDATITGPAVETFALGARVSPRITWSRLTAWLTAGAGWGRVEAQRMTATTAGGASFVLRERGGSFVEIPLGLGVSFEVVRRWLSIDVQGTAAFVIGQRGEAFEDAQTVDDAGRIRNVLPLPAFDASLVQTIGISLLL